MSSELAASWHSADCVLGDSLFDVLGCLSSRCRADPGLSRVRNGVKCKPHACPVYTGPACVRLTPSLRNAALWGESWAGVSYHFLWKSNRLGCVDMRLPVASRGTLWHLHRWLTNILPRCAFPEPDNPTSPDRSTVPFQKRDPRLREIRRPSRDLGVEWWTPQYGPSDACELCQSPGEMT